MGLIQQQARRLAEQADGQAHPLAPAAGEAIQALVCAIAELGKGHGVGHGLVRLRPVPELEAREERKVLAHGEPLVERWALGHPAQLLGPGLHATGLGRLHASEHLQQRRLARTVGTDDGEPLTASHLEPDPVEDPSGAARAHEPAGGQCAATGLW